MSIGIRALPGVHQEGTGESQFDLPLIPSSPGWMEDAACRDLLPAAADALFFPGPGNQPIKQRKLLCGPCPVKEECFEYGMANAEFGWWGGRNVGKLILRDARFARTGQLKVT